MKYAFSLFLSSSFSIFMTTEKLVGASSVSAYSEPVYSYYELSRMTYHCANRQMYCDITYYADGHARVYYTRESDITRVPCHLINKIVILSEANNRSACNLYYIIFL